MPIERERDKRWRSVKLRHSFQPSPNQNTFRKQEGWLPHQYLTHLFDVSAGFGRNDRRWVSGHSSQNTGSFSPHRPALHDAWGSAATWQVRRSGRGHPPPSDHIIKPFHSQRILALRVLSFQKFTIIAIEIV